MSNIIPFKPRERECRYYSFSLNYDQYLLVYFEDTKEVSFYKAHYTDDDEIKTKPLSKEKIQELFDSIFDYFFLSVDDPTTHQHQERYALLLQFDFEDELFGVYYHEDDSSLPMLLFKIVDKKAEKIENPFQLKRAVHYFQEKFDVEMI